MLFIIRYVRASCFTRPENCANHATANCNSLSEADCGTGDNTQCDWNLNEEQCTCRNIFVPKGSPAEKFILFEQSPTEKEVIGDPDHFFNNPGFAGCEINECGIHPNSIPATTISF